MKILFVLDAVAADQVGGIAKSIQTEMEELAARGHHVRILTRKQIAGSAARESIGGVEVVRMPGPVKGSRAYYSHPLFTVVRSPRAIERVCTEWEPDVVYVHSTFFANGVARARIAAAKVFCFHAPAAEEIAIDASGGKYGIAAPFAKAAVKRVINVERQAIRGADVVFTRSNFMCERLVALHPEFDKSVITVVPIMVDTEHYAFCADGGDARKRLDLDSDRPIVVTVRRLVNRMGLPELLHAIKNVAREHSDVLLLVAGKGYMESALQALVAELGLQENVRILGFVAEEQLPDLYAAATLCVVPSMALEGFGLVSIEAMSTGRVVVATPVGGNLEVVGGFDQSLIAKACDPSALAEVIGAALPTANDATLRRRVRDFCEAHYSRAAVGTTLEHLLERAVSMRAERRRVS